LTCDVGYFSFYLLIFSLQSPDLGFQLVDLSLNIVNQSLQSPDLFCRITSCLTKDGFDPLLVLLELLLIVAELCLGLSCISLSGLVLPP
jgi:hypothetical protein